MRAPEEDAAVTAAVPGIWSPTLSDGSQVRLGDVAVEAPTA